MAEKLTTNVSPIALEDAMLVRQVQDGDAGAFGRLVVKYQDRAVNLCWRMCGSLEDSQDLAQEAFLRAFEKIGAYRFEASFYTWLFRIVVNTVLTQRRRKRRVTLSLHDGDGKWADYLRDEHPAGRQTDEADDPLSRLSAREMQQQLLAGLERLDDDHRAIIVLRDIEAMDYRQIAEVLEITVGTVKSRLFRARMALREMILGPKATSADMR